MADQLHFVTIRQSTPGKLKLSLHIGIARGDPHIDSFVSKVSFKKFILLG